MLGAVVIVLVGILFWVITGMLLRHRRQALDKSELMRRVDTYSAANVSGISPGKMVEVTGNLRCQRPLTSAMAEQECAYYHSRVIREYEETERDSEGELRTERKSETVASNEQFAPFAVEDESGIVGVRGEGAEVDAIEVMNRFERDSGGSISLGELTVALGGGENTVGYRYVESILRIDEPVYVLGVVQEDGHLGRPDEGDKDGRFLISYRSEEQLMKKYKRDALIMTLIAIVTFLFGTAFVILGVADITGVADLL